MEDVASRRRRSHLMTTTSASRTPPLIKSNPAHHGHLKQFTQQRQLPNSQAPARHDTHRTTCPGGKGCYAASTRPRHPHAGRPRVGSTPGFVSSKPINRLRIGVITHTAQVLSDNRILSAPVLQDGLEFIGFVDTHDLLRGLIKHVYPELLEQVVLSAFNNAQAALVSRNTSSSTRDCRSWSCKPSDQNTSSNRSPSTCTVTMVCVTRAHYFTVTIIRWRPLVPSRCKQHAPGHLP